MNHSILTLVSLFAIPAALGACSAGGESNQTSRNTLDTVSETALDSPSESRCAETPTSVKCSKNSTRIDGREVHWQIPVGTPPAGGWPTVLIFQGSLFTAELTWQAEKGLPFGAYYQTLVVKRLLDHGFAVIAPEAHGEGTTFWDTNNPLFALNWKASGDHRLMLAIFDAIDSGKFGQLRGTRMYATGISSGGYMTSRMGVAYPERFAALGVQSGSYATCAGPVCSVPALSSDHPPTLLLHGSADLTVPLYTARRYEAALKSAGIDNDFIVRSGAGHEWIAEAPDAVLRWFQSHP
ncbi:prolyl oligopeptidase family serine peptidase [Pendulispora albinea]|uniref:Prolyl oligopeptidase family serine peptidase n=1 Tax=Pendulispora albinea TaxID=2741071 RepID=A0ABZ2M7N8_9BACT